MHWKSLLEPRLGAKEVHRVKGRVLVGATCPGGVFLTWCLASSCSNPTGKPEQELW